MSSQLPDRDLLAVRLGALALAITDAQEAAHPDQIASEAPDAALLNSVAQTPGLKVDDLSGILGLSHSGTVRAIDRLVRKGLMERRAHPVDARAVALHLTGAGATEAKGLQSGRKRVLQDRLAPLSDAELMVISAAVDRVLSLIITERISADRACRLCDETLCAAETCPAEAFAQGRR